MNKRLKISIPSPCHEKWQDMTPAEKGRFCASCQKVVHDFTRSSDKEIASALVKDKNACGRFLNTQLDRDLVIPKEKSTIWMAASAAVVSFITLGTNAAIAQTPVQTEQHQEDQLTLGKVALPTIQPHVVSGTVVDETGLPLPGVKVIIKGTQTGVQTDFDGRYSIEANQGDVLEFSFVGYRTKIVSVNESENINVEFDEAIELMGDITFFVEKTTFFGRAFRTIGNWFRREDVDVWYK
jgi:hypothetical protein